MRQETGTPGGSPGGTGKTGPGKAVLERVLDSMENFVLVTDAETDEILFLNRRMKEAYGLEAPEGQVCWKVFRHQLEDRCSYCPVASLREDAEPYFWVEQEEESGRRFQNCDSLIRWVDGRLAHLQQSVDITEREELREQAVQDGLTGVLNRRAGKAAFEAMRGKAAAAGERFTFCMFDMNDLKAVNERYGRAKGDRLLLEAVRAVRGVLEEEDSLCRMSGDEFTLYLYGCGETEAAARLERAQASLAERAVELGFAPGDTPGFCYGVWEIAPGMRPGFSEAFDGADARMYQQKRKRHIQAAARRAKREERALPGNSAAFEYDQGRLYDALIRSTDDYIYLCNMRTGVFRYPPAMVEEFGLPGEVVENAAAVWSGKIHEHDRGAFLEANQEISDGRSDSHSVEYRAKNRRGEWVWLRCRGHLERDENGEPALFAGIVTNLGLRSHVDQLTGLANKFALEKRVSELIGYSGKQSFSFLLLDLDDFKYINDLYDRQFGDGVLRLLSQRIQSLLPANATAYRMDGDEFGVLLRGGGRETVAEFYRQLKESFSTQQEYGGKKFFCTVSAGCARYPKNGKGYLDLMKYAHYSLEHAKTGGKNRLVFFSEEILEDREHSLSMTEELRECVEHGMRGFTLFYQPQVDAGTGSLCGAEALLRWNSEKFGAVPPVEFIPLLEESGLIRKAGRWVFQQAARACAKWAGRLGGFLLSVNVSYLQLEDPDFLEFLEDAMRKSGADPKRMALEFTESCIAYNQAALAGTFRRIRQLGVKIAMDDFGTGYSSLGLLKQSPADIVKIDRTFVRGIRNSTFDSTFIRFIVELCHDVDITVCLEGVETPEEYETVRPMRLDSIQGFLFGRPMPEQEFEKLLG